MTDQFGTEFHRSVSDLISRATESLAVAEVIGTNMDALNRSPYRTLFGHLQLVEADNIVLNLAKMFDPPPRKYPTRSIPGVLRYLKDNADTLPISSRERIHSWLAERRIDVSKYERFSDSDLTRFFADEFQRYIDDSAAPLNRSLERIRFRRDKEVAHNEAVVSEERIQVAWADLRLVLRETQAFAGIVGPSYFDFHFEASDGTYMLERFDHDSAKQLQRALDRCGLSQL